MFQKLTNSVIGRGQMAIGGAVEELERRLDQRIDIAVTGLRRAGKTVFITSVIQNLFASARNPGYLDFFSPTLKGVEECPAGASDLPAFPTRRFLEDLGSENPKWPNATDSVSRTEIKIRYERKSMLMKHIKKDGILTIGLIDYPGEWLLDLPFLKLSFDDWSIKSPYPDGTGSLNVLDERFALR